MAKIIDSGAPKVAAVHDLSCVGRCALTVVIPALAAMGIQPCPLPTAVLSTHTGGYEGMASRDLTGFMRECLDHWGSIGLRFDAIYSGYLAGSEQAGIVARLIRERSAAGGALVVVDPVMGDEGRMYSGIPADMPAEMRKLCAMADYITPNCTEAALLTGAEYSGEPRTPGEIESALDGLLALGARGAVITGVPVGGGACANALKRVGEGGYWSVEYAPFPAHYPGAGDLFASIITGELLLGARPEEALARATWLSRDSVALSLESASEARAGLQIERALSRMGGRRDSPAPPPKFRPSARPVLTD